MSGTDGPWTKRNYHVRFSAPAFLGNAEQAAQWRAPPFKALLRHWWRIAWCEGDGFRDRVDALRAAEDELFGAAAGSEGGRASRVRLRLDQWKRGKLSDWKAVGNFPVAAGAKATDASLYLGYGPVTFARGKGPKLTHPPAIGAEKTTAASLSLAFPEDAAPLLDRAMALIHLYGTVGGRSRNGWGSVHLDPPAPADAAPPLRDWEACLDRDWPHAIGRDGQGALIWRTRQPRDKWEAVIRDLAGIRKAVNAEIRPREFLNYPVTKLNARGFDRNARLPSALRFKVREHDGAYTGVVFHVPCRIPAKVLTEETRGAVDEKGLRTTWQRAHRLLDDHNGLERAPA